MYQKHLRSKISKASKLRSPSSPYYLHISIHTLHSVAMLAGGQQEELPMAKASEGSESLGPQTAQTRQQMTADDSSALALR